MITTVQVSALVFLAWAAHACSAAFERGGQTPMSAYSIPYQIREGGQYIHDAEWAPGERYTIAGIIAHSSNVGMSQVASHISEQTQYDYLLSLIHI